SNMSKLLFFVFIGVCLMAIHLSHAAEQEEEDDQYLNALVESVKPEIQKQFEEADARVEIMEEQKREKEEFENTKKKNSN
ncbi:hypothetical protein L9G16_20390, partial [Shewanella sp. A25]|nr:hypothetical protein [Shewanella shenzhenensis]